MFEYLRLRESFATMFFIIWGMMAKLGSFIVILMVVLLAFTSLDFVAFGSSRGRSMAFMSSLVSRFQGSLGDVDFESAAELDQDWGMAFLVFFIFVAVLLLLNLLIAVMSEAYDEVKEVAEARWAYVQMEMLVEYEAERGEQASSSNSSEGCCGGRCSRGGAGSTKHHKVDDDEDDDDTSPVGLVAEMVRPASIREEADDGETKG
jgi:hypothetical protein